MNVEVGGAGGPGGLGRVGLGGRGLKVGFVMIGPVGGAGGPGFLVGLGLFVGLGLLVGLGLWVGLGFWVGLGRWVVVTALQSLHTQVFLHFFLHSVVGLVVQVVSGFDVQTSLYGTHVQTLLTLVLQLES